MFSKAFLEYQDKIPKAPPSMDGAGMPGPGPGGAPIPEEFAHLRVPMMPPDYVPPEPEIPVGYQGVEIPGALVLQQDQRIGQGQVFPVKQGPEDLRSLTEMTGFELGQSDEQMVPHGLWAGREPGICPQRGVYLLHKRASFPVVLPSFCGMGPKKSSLPDLLPSAVTKMKENDGRI